MSDPEIVHYEARDGIAVITLDRPPVNAFNTPMWEAVVAAVERLGADETVKVGILTGTGPKAFSAGADVRELSGLEAATRAKRNLWVMECMRKVAGAAVPLIAAVNGPAVGGAVNLITMFDHRMASADATFSLPEIDRGTLGGGGVFLRKIGVREAVLREILYTGRRLTAEEARAAGIVDRVVPSAELMPAARALATAIAAKSRRAVVLMKAAIVATESEPDWVAGYRVSMEHAAALMGTPEAKEGLAAFLEKREAR